MSWNKYLYYILSLKFKFRYEFRPNDVRLLTHYLLKTNRTLFCLLPSKEFLPLKHYWHSLKWMQVHFCFVQKISWQQVFSEKSLRRRFKINGKLGWCCNISAFLGNGLRPPWPSKDKLKCSCLAFSSYLTGRDWFEQSSFLMALPFPDTTLFPRIGCVDLENLTLKGNFYVFTCKMSQEDWVRINCWSADWMLDWNSRINQVPRRLGFCIVSCTLRMLLRSQRSVSGKGQVWYW